MNHDHAQILIVEDEPLQSMALMELVEDMACVPVGPAANSTAALRLLPDCRVDAALLDISLDGGGSFVVADELARLGIPWIFVTGHNASLVDDRYRNVPVATKPISPRHLSRMLADLLERSLPPARAPVANAAMRQAADLPIVTRGAGA